MNLTQDKLKTLYENKNNIFSRKENLANRFLVINEIVDKFSEISIEPKYIKEFGPLSDELLGGFGDDNRKKMIDEGIENVDDMWKLIGGYDGNKVQDKYRIISASRGKKENFYENENYSTYHSSLWANSNFVTNQYPHQVAQFLQSCMGTNKDFNSCIAASKMVLTWETETYLDKDDYFNSSKKRLNTRFPPKFLWMWANKNTVIHPYSLMAFRNFIDTEYIKNLLNNLEAELTPEKLTNIDFDNFVNFWPTISNLILKDLSINTNIKDISDLSKLISIIMIEETDIKNISDLLKTGNKAVILWGPPGTGKTYESMQVVRELFNIDSSIKDEQVENEYLFSKKNNSSNFKGYYEIIQFHPNYTYEDFIGGIFPKLDKSEVSYELREGVFKKFCDEANKNINKEKKYIFIIDEINRAELSAVFGELLFALEYRGKHITLPHFDNSFTIPENVYIIGTMNNVDKSLVTFDLALRRRFGFFKLMPNLNVIFDVLGDKISEESIEAFVEKCKILNIFISKSKTQLDDHEKELIKSNEELFIELGDDKQIGQAYYFKIQDFIPKVPKNKINLTSYEYEKLWVYHLEPLLEEYLGMSIEDDGIQNKLNKLKTFFIEE